MYCGLLQVFRHNADRQRRINAVGHSSSPPHHVETVVYNVVSRVVYTQVDIVGVLDHLVATSCEGCGVVGQVWSVDRGKTVVSRQVVKLTDRPFLRICK